MRPPRTQPEDRRTTITVSPVVWVMAEEMMAAKGFSHNFSSYVCDLIRRDKERHAAQAPVAPAAPANSAPDVSAVVAAAVEASVRELKRQQPDAPSKFPPTTPATRRPAGSPRMTEHSAK